MADPADHMQMKAFHLHVICEAMPSSRKPLPSSRLPDMLEYFEPTAQACETGFQQLHIAPMPTGGQRATDTCWTDSFPGQWRFRSSILFVVEVESLVRTQYSVLLLAWEGRRRGIAQTEIRHWPEQHTQSHRSCRNAGTRGGSACAAPTRATQSKPQPGPEQRAQSYSSRKSSSGGAACAAPS